MLTGEIWAALDRLVADSEIEIDRPRGSNHPRFPEIVYPLDYGFLKETRAADGDGVDVWLGESGSRDLVGVLIAVDTFKRDIELKLLLGCTQQEMELACETSNRGNQTAQLVTRTG